ncbi:MAG: ATP-binding cassette domain-containing protein [Vagococcus sp.]
MIELCHVSKEYNGRTTHNALNDVSLSIKKGEIVGVVGESGSGKSTLLRLLNVMEHPTKGDIIFNGTSVSKWNQEETRRYKQQVGMVFQQFNLLNNLTVSQNVALPQKLYHQVDEQKVQLFLDFVGLADKKDSYPVQLSGGQKQRVAIARALINQPKLILWDEATSALDERTTDDILAVLSNYYQEFKPSIVFVSHELSTVKKMCQRAIILENGQLIGETRINKQKDISTKQAYLDRVIGRLQT